MADEKENLYKRVDDQEWRKSVDTRLVTLTAAQKQADDELDKLDKRIEELEELLEGDPLKRDDSGLKGDVKELNAGLNSLRAIMAPDALGHGGIRNRLEACEQALGLREKNTEFRWRTAIAIIGATATITTALVTNLDRIERSLKRFWQHDVVSESRKPKSSMARTNKKRRARPAVMETPTEGANDNSPEENLPE